MCAAGDDAADGDDDSDDGANSKPQSQLDPYDNGDNADDDDVLYVKRPVTKCMKKCVANVWHCRVLDNQEGMELRNPGADVEEDKK